MMGIDRAHSWHFPDPDSGKTLYLLKRKCKKFEFLQENQLYKVIHAGNRLRAFPKREIAFLTLTQGK
jgi:hypothetical protein